MRGGMRRCHLQSHRFSSLSFLAQVAQLCERALRLHKEGPNDHSVVAKVKEFGGRLGEMMGISTYQLIGMVGGMVA